MTNREKYKQAFSVLRASDDFSLEVNVMEKTVKRWKLNRIVAVVAACAMMIGGMTMAYAADVGGIQRTVQIWFNGDQTSATVTFDGNGNYSMEHTDDDGNVHYQAGGGVSFLPDGTEVPVTEYEIMEYLAGPDVQYEENGTVCVYWGDQKVDITDKFEDDVCYVKLENGDDTLYMTVKYQNGFATSPHRYLSPREFN